MGLCALPKAAEKLLKSSLSSLLAQNGIQGVFEGVRLFQGSVRGSHQGVLRFLASPTVQPSRRARCEADDGFGKLL